jgi:hypothetical protein
MPGGKKFHKPPGYFSRQWSAWQVKFNTINSHVGVYAQSIGNQLEY